MYGICLIKHFQVVNIKSRAAPIPPFTDTSNTKYSARKYLQVQVPIPSTLK